MAGVHPLSDAVVWRARLPRAAGRSGVLVAVPLLLLATTVLARALLTAAPSHLPVLPGAEDAPAGELTAFAGQTLESALAEGGGITFEIVQTSTITAREGGPLVAIPDPTDREKILGEAPRYVIGTLIARGVAQPAGYWLELIHGPAPGAEAEYDVAKAQVSRQALVRDGTLYRNDGDGWHETDLLPGIGLDPATLTALTRYVTQDPEVSDAVLARPSEAPVDAEAAPLGPETRAVDADVLAATLTGLKGPERPAVRALAGEATPADVPGVIAPDLADFTELLAPVELRFDDGGRLVGLTILARNTHLDVHDLVVETVITLRYPAAPSELPVPEPRYVEPPIDPDAATEEQDR